MKKQTVLSILALSLSVVMASCGSTAGTTVESSTDATTQAPEVQQEASVISYTDAVELEQGDTLTLDMLGIVTDGDLEFDFEEKTYTELGTFNESISYGDGETLTVTVTVVDKTAPAILGATDIEVVDGEAIDILSGVSSDDAEATLSASDYDVTLVGTAQPITITAVDKVGNKSETTINLTIKENPIEAMNTVMYAQSNINIRSGAGKDYDKLATLSTNDELCITGRHKETGWYQVSIDGQVGYVSSDYVGDNKVVIQAQTSSGSSSNSSQSSQTSSGSSQTASTSQDTSQSSSSSQTSSSSADPFRPSTVEDFNELRYECDLDAGWIDENGNYIYDSEL